MSSNSWSGFMKKSQKQQLKSKPKPRTSNPRKRKLNPNSNSIVPSSTSKRRKLSNIQHVQCPMCDKQLLSHLINFHIEEHFLKPINTSNQQHSHTDTSPSTTTSDTTSNTNTNSANSTPPQSPTNNEAPKQSKPPKICPLFTSGPLPSSMFTKPKKRSSGLKPTQQFIFYVEITTDNTDQHITSWNAQWIDNTSEIDEFISKSKEMGYFMNDVMIKEPNTIGRSKVYLICNYPSRSEGTMTVISNDFKFNYPSPNNYRFSPSLCKSLLQKCVRTSAHQSAVKAAYLLLLKDNLQGLLRRLSIIIIEDVILMKDFVLLMWLLLAESKSNENEKYHPSMCWYNFVFSLVKKCAKYQVKDYMDYAMHPKDDEYINLLTPLQYEDVDINKLMIRCMLMRASYGGMKCDVAMLRSYACIWHNRFFGETKHCSYYEERLAKLNISKEIEDILSQNKSEIQLMMDKNHWVLFMDGLDDIYSASSVVTMKSILPLCNADLILSAVDFHCSNMLSVLCNNGNGECWRILRDYLNGNDNNANDIEGFLKLMIWEFRSSTTDKVGLLMKEKKPMELLQIWRNIQPIVNGFSLKYIKSRTINRY